MPLPVLWWAKHEGLASGLVVNLVRAPCLASGSRSFCSLVPVEVSDFDGMICLGVPPLRNAILPAQALPSVALRGASAGKKLPPAPAGDLMSVLVQLRCKLA